MATSPLNPAAGNPRPANRNPLRRFRVAFALFIGLALLSGAARAEDPPARAGRVSEISGGDAWIFDREARDWERLARNQTLEEGDRLRSDAGARLTLRIGSTTLWLDERSELEVERMDDERVLLRVERGGLAMRLRSREQAQDYRLLTREGRAFPDGEGLFRIDQLQRGTRAVAWQGRLRFEFRDPQADPVWLTAGEQAEFWWADGPRTERQGTDRDAFARWLQNQREAEGEIETYRYVSPEMTGAEDLDRYGRWETHVEYGAIWFPYQVAPGWEPYRHGRWVWTSRWGWTWVDEAPWGFAPFHYGRWLLVGGRWCWVPGRYVARPVYAPALVSWSININLGSSGRRPPPPRPGMWAPLPPREVYQPVYRHTPGYRDRINHEHQPAPQPMPPRVQPQPPRQGDGRGERPPVERPGDRFPDRPYERPGERKDDRPNDRGGRGGEPGADRGGERPPQPGRGVQPPVMPAPPVVVPQPAPLPPPVSVGRPESPRPARPDEGGTIERPRQRVEPGERSEPVISPIFRRPDGAQMDSGSEQVRRPERAFEPRPATPVMERSEDRPIQRQIERPAERPAERAPEMRPMPMPSRAPQPNAERPRPAPSEEPRGDKPGNRDKEPGKRDQQQR